MAGRTATSHYRTQIPHASRKSSGPLLCCFEKAWASIIYKKKIKWENKYFRWNPSSAENLALSAEGFYPKYLFSFLNQGFHFLSLLHTFQNSKPCSHFLASFTSKKMVCWITTLWAGITAKLTVSPTLYLLTIVRKNEKQCQTIQCSDAFHFSDVRHFFSR